MRYLYLFITLAVAIAQAQEVIWVRNGDWNEAHFGGLILPLGDQNEDGFADWAVFSGGSNDQPSGLDDRLDFFYGGNPPSQTPYLTFRPREGAEAPYMYNLTTIGDFNGDGYIDWVIGYFIPGLDSATFELYGGGASADTISEVILRMPFEVTLDRLGHVGDHNGDGYADVYYHRREADLTFFYFGNGDWNMSVDLVNQGEPLGSGNSRPSFDVFGDFNGDGFDDYAARTGSHTYFYWGSADPDTVPDIEWAGNFAFPATLSTDLNGDGAADLAVSRDPGTVEVIIGNPEPSPTPTFFLEYEGCNNVAHSINTASDFNSDGYDDLVLVNDPCDNGFGRLCLFLGGPWLNPNPILQLSGMSSPPFNNVPIWRAIGLGDINGDNIDDLAIGCQRDINDGRRGRVVILSGDTTLHVPVGGFPPLAEEFSMSIFPNPANGFVQIDLSTDMLRREGEIQIYNLLGQEVDRLNVPSNVASLSYSVAHLSTGIYLARAEFGTQALTQKLVVLK